MLTQFSFRSKKSSSVRYVCEVCLREFPNKRAITKHHSHNNTFNCCKCDAIFNVSSKFYSHLEAHQAHTILIDEDNEELILDSDEDSYLLDDSECVSEVVIDHEEIEKENVSEEVMEEHQYVLRRAPSKAPNRRARPRTRKPVNFSEDDYEILSADEEVDCVHYRCIKCDQLFINRSGFASHIKKRKCKINGCDVCGATFERNSEFYSHYKMEHTHKAICKFCFLTLSERNIKQHMMRHLDLFRHRCEECNKGFYTAREYRSHYNNRHREVRHMCATCNRSFTDAYFFRRHMARHVEADVVVLETSSILKKSICGPCGPISVTPLGTQKRRRTKKAVPQEKRDSSSESKGTEAVHCEVCDESYPNNVDFALHSIKHTSDNKYSCHFCEYRNASKYHIKMHIKAHEGTTKYKCEICQKAFTVSTQAIEHKYYHTGEKPFQCEICGKHFMFSWFLTSHRRTQHWEIITGTPLVKYDCTICNKHYTSSTGLRWHNSTKHNVGKAIASVLCDICGKHLSSKQKLEFHRRIHTGYKPHGCVICNKSFSKKEQLKEHERVHTGEKPFICNFCGKGFTQRSPLRIHERIHTGERPYVCRLCQKGFVSKGVMDTHMKSCLAIPKY